MSASLRNREMITQLGLGTLVYRFAPGRSGMPLLDAHAQLFGMYQISANLVVEYIAACGTNTPGDVVVGIDFHDTPPSLTYQATAALDPKITVACWKNGRLSVPLNKSMKQKWLTISSDPVDSPSAFVIQVSNTSTISPGNLWIEYCVEFASPNLTKPLALSTIPVRVVSQWTLDTSYSTRNELTLFSSNLSKEDARTFPLPDVEIGQEFYIASCNIHLSGSAIGLAYVSSEDHAWTSATPVMCTSPTHPVRTAVYITKARKIKDEWWHPADWPMAYEYTYSANESHCVQALYFSRDAAALVSLLKLE